MVRFDICWAGMVDFTAVAIIGWVRGRVGLGCGVVWGPTVPEVGHCSSGRNRDWCG